MRGKIIYGLVGVVLAAATIFTGSYGLGKQNVEIYEMALNQQKAVDQLGLKQFQLKDYSVRCFDGMYDYVLTTKAGKTECQKEDSALGAFVATAYEVNGTYQVIIPTMEQFQKLFQVSDLASGIASEQSSFDLNRYGKEEQTASIWHEATHAWQLTHYQYFIEQLTNPKKTENNLEDDSQENSTESEVSGEKIVQYVDNNPQAVSLFKQGMQCLEKAVQAKHIDDKKNYVLQYNKIEKQRRALLPEEVLAEEDYYETVEGMAHYVEAKVYEQLKGSKAYQENYIKSIGEYSKGTYKYYCTGMAKCLLMDVMNQDWKSEFHYEQSISELLEESLNLK